MRQLSLLLLLATAAAPALAADDTDRGGRHHRGQGSEQSESREQRPVANRRSEAGQGRAPDIQRTERGQASQPQSTERRRDLFRQQREASTPATENQPGRDWRRAGRDGGVSEAGEGLRPRERRVRTIPDTQPAPAATQPPATRHGGFEGRAHRDYRDGRYRRWSHDWRHDRRYDWHHYRNRHRSIFRIGIYYDPFGWNYRRWSIGSHIWPGYYGSRYWLNDPWQYRLPPAYGPYRWVRYWNDALLVNIYTGEVVDVIHGFFW